MNQPRALDPLTRAAIRHGSDKFGGHLYTPIYHELFQHIRDQPLKFLEIGVGGYNTPEAGGASLKMWADYFPYAQIVGLDIEPKTLDLNPRIQVIQGSQTDLDLLEPMNATRGPFDIIIDDGSHIVSHMSATFTFLYPLMSPSGIYVIEDVQTSFTPQAGGDRTGDGTIFALANRVSLAMHRNEGFKPLESQPADVFGSITKSVSTYRNQVVFHRGSNTYPSNSGLDFDNPEIREMFQLIGAKTSTTHPPNFSLPARNDHAHLNR